VTGVATICSGDDSPRSSQGIDCSEELQLLCYSRAKASRSLFSCSSGRLVEIMGARMRCLLRAHLEGGALPRMLYLEVRVPRGLGKLAAFFVVSSFSRLILTP
jgi:hypothetical protein